MLPGDRAALLNILDAIPEFSPTDVPVAREVIDGYLRDPVGSGYNILIAETGKDIVGYICYGPTPLTQGTWDIYWMATLPERQGQGIGGDLMVSAESQVRESGGRLILIETSARPDYKKARRFYQYHGFEVVCRIPDFYAPGEERITLRKKLDR
jgi:ribosomal protein S18 acetylase RimI-like enzyme